MKKGITIKKELETQIKELWDFITSNIGLDKRSIESLADLWRLLARQKFIKREEERQKDK